MVRDKPELATNARPVPATRDGGGGRGNPNRINRAADMMLTSWGQGLTASCHEWCGGVAAWPAGVAVLAAGRWLRETHGLATGMGKSGRERDVEELWIAADRKLP